MTGAVEAQASQTQFSGVHAALTGLAADDHLQYALLAGRALGQTLIGGTAPGETLALRGSADADTGRITALSGIDSAYDWSTQAGAAMFRWAATIPASGGIITAGFDIQNDITVTGATFILSALDDHSILNWTVSPGFAVTTLFFARPTYRGLNAGIPPAQCFLFAAQAAYDIQGAGNVTVTNYKGFSFSPILRVRNAGDDLTITAITGLTVGPLWNTNNATAVADFGTIRGVHCLNPSAVLFGQSLGTETMANYIGLDMNSITLAVTGVRAAVRSNLVANAANFFLQNTGGAESDFGDGDIHLNDNTYVKFGATIALADLWMAWNTAQSALVFTTFAGVGGNPLFLRPTAQDEWVFQHNNNGTQDVGIGFNVNAISFGVTLPTPNSNNWFVQFAGPNLRQVQIGGEYSDVLWTASGSIDVNGLAVSDLQAFKINSPAVILNGGTIDDISNLFVQAMPSFGATRTQALRVLGRSRLDGHINQGSQAPAQITANQNNYQLAANNGQRGVALLDSDDNYNITGIDSAFGFAQDGDLIKLVNIGAFNLTLTHEDTGSLAANRFLRANALDFVLAPGDTVEIWKDDTATDRWRILETISTGAGLLSGPWAFSTTTGAADPGAGRLRYDNATPASVTNIYIDQLTDNGGDAQNILAALANGDQLYIQDQRDAANFLVFDITSVTDNTGWFTIAGTVNASGGLPANNRVLTVSARFA